MTHTQELMLAICCGACAGQLIGQILSLIAEGIWILRDKRKKKKENNG